jgi:hypothetical protein
MRTAALLARFSLHCLAARFGEHRTGGFARDLEELLDEVDGALIDKGIAGLANDRGPRLVERKT